MSRERIGAAATGQTRPISPARRRTWDDRIAVRFPSAYRRLARLQWRLFEALRPGHRVRRAFVERILSRSYGAFNRNDLAALLPIYHTECIWDWSHFEGWPDDQAFRGPEGLRRGWLVFSEAWGDFHIEPSDFRDRGDRLMITCHMRAIGLGSGVGLETTWWQVGYARDGLIAHVANYTDHDEALEAVGLSE